MLRRQTVSRMGTFGSRLHPSPHFSGGCTGVVPVATCCSTPLGMLFMPQQQRCFTTTLQRLAPSESNSTTAMKAAEEGKVSDAKVLKMEKAGKFRLQAAQALMTAATQVLEDEGCNRTALYYAASGGYLECVKHLTSKGAKLEVVYPTPCGSSLRPHRRRPTLGGPRGQGGQVAAGLRSSTRGEGLRLYPDPHLQHDPRFRQDEIKRILVDAAQQQQQQQQPECSPAGGKQ